MRGGFSAQGHGAAGVAVVLPVHLPQIHSTISEGTLLRRATSADSFTRIAQGQPLRVSSTEELASSRSLVGEVAPQWSKVLRHDSSSGMPLCSPAASYSKALLEFQKAVEGVPSLDKGTLAGAGAPAPFMLSPDAISPAPLRSMSYNSAFLSSLSPRGTASRQGTGAGAHLLGLQHERERVGPPAVLPSRCSPFEAEPEEGKVARVGQDEGSVDVHRRIVRMQDKVQLRASEPPRLVSIQAGPMKELQHIREDLEVLGSRVVEAPEHSLDALEKEVARLRAAQQSLKGVMGLKQGQHVQGARHEEDREVVASTAVSELQAIKDKVQHMQASMGSLSGSHDGVTASLYSHLSLVRDATSTLEDEVTVSWEEKDGAAERLKQARVKTAEDARRAAESLEELEVLAKEVKELRGEQEQHLADIQYLRSEIALMENHGAVGYATRLLTMNSGGSILGLNLGHFSMGLCACQGLPDADDSYIDAID